MSAQVFRLPDLGEGLTEAEVVTWHVAVGDEVRIDQEVVTVETAKAAVDVPCPFSGPVTELHAEPGTVVPVGDPLISIGVAQEQPGPPETAESGTRSQGSGSGLDQYRTEERAGSAPPPQAEGNAGEPERPLIGYGAGEGPARRRRAGRRGGVTIAASPVPGEARSDAAARGQAVRVISPLVRKLAKEYGIDLAQVTPGPTGVVRRVDLEAARRTTSATSLATGSAPATGRRHPAGPAPEERRVPIHGVHRLMVERLTTSRREIPEATTWVDVDATRLVKTRDALRSAHPDAGIGVLALLARFVVAGLRTYPALNSSVDLEAGEIVHHGRINLGFAAQSPRGLVVPVVHDAHSMSTIDLATQLRQLTVKARDGLLTPADLTGGTFTLNNYGVFGVDGSTPIINHPEAAMLGVGRIADKPWVHKGRVKVRKVTQLSFTFDHRVCDGGTAGGFLRFVADCVEEPAVLLGGL